MSLVVRSIFDDAIRKMLMSVKDLIYFESIHDGAYNSKISWFYLFSIRSYGRGGQ